MDFRKDLINTEKLDELIEAHKDLYLQSYANVLKIPSLNARCEEGIAETDNEDKKKTLTTQIEQNNAHLAQNKEQMKNISEMHDALLTFKESL